jgi:MinD superfamily P-loop ATPase
LASLAKSVVFCDNDVDAADLHLLLHPKIEEKHTFKGAWVASIDPEKCTNCGICSENCRFDAIHFIDEQYAINAFQCEGCRLCERVCPVGAIQSEQSIKNHWFVSSTRFGKLVHAHMTPGEENSGKLVSVVRNKANSIANVEHSDYVINDGPPGIGCTVISSITGTDHVLMVIEPSLSGLHDAKRVIELVKSFNVDLSAIINKFDLNLELSQKIEDYLKEEKIPLLSKLPFNKKMVESMINGKTIVEYAPNSSISKEIKMVWEQLKR